MLPAVSTPCFQIDEKAKMLYKHFNLSLEEIEVVEELKNRTQNAFTPAMLDDETICYRFAKARDFNLKHAETMLRKHILWRKEMQLDTILTDYKPPEVLEIFGPTSFVCLDKEGCPVRYIDIGNIDQKGFFKATKHSEMVKYNVMELEKEIRRMKEESKKRGKFITKLVIIYNFENFTFAKATHRKSVELMMEGINMLQDNYPERIKHIYHINTSLYFSIAFAAIKSFLAAALLEKLSFYRTEGWKEELLKEIDADVLPVFLGGNRTDSDGDPLCKSFIKHGQLLPEKYMRKRSSRSLAASPEATRLVVSRFSKSDVELEVRHPGSYLEWEFETKCRDIGFGVFFRDRAQLEPLVPKQRIDTCLEPEAGIYKCERPGKYVIAFDNSYSWFYSKEIYYRAKVLDPIIS